MILLRALKALADVLVWTLAVIGVLCGALWAAGQAGLVQPLVVVSGSMEPAIMTGDLLLDTPVPVQQVEVGDVVSLPNPATGVLVTHRVVDIAPQDDGTWHVRMQGDANDTEDGGAYVVTDDTVLSPRWQVPGGGDFITRLTRPSTAVPLLVALAALLALSRMPASRTGHERARDRRPSPQPSGSEP